MSTEFQNIQSQPPAVTDIGNFQPQSSLPPIASIESEKGQRQPSLPPKDTDPVLWPFEPFPPPPEDGFWLPKYAPPPRPRFRSALDEIPPPPPRTFSPPLMALTYPPPPPLDERDPNWLLQMLADVQRQRAFLVDCLEEAHAEAVNAYAEVGLAQAELEEEMAAMQEFIDTVASVAGNGFVRRMLAHVNHDVERMSKGLNVDDDGDDNGAGAAEEELEDVASDDGGYESSVSSSFDVFGTLQPTRGPVRDPPSSALLSGSFSSQMRGMVPALQSRG